MRWDELFADLEGQLDSAAAGELAAEVADRTRREAATLRLVDRLRPAVGHPVVVAVAGGLRVVGTLRETASTWLLVDEDGSRQALMPLHAVVTVGGLGSRSAAPGTEGAVASRLGLGHALRGIARDRLPVTLHLLDGSRVHGTVDRVGADFVEITEHPVGDPRRRDAVTGTRAVPFAALAAVRG